MHAFALFLFNRMRLVDKVPKSSLLKDVFRCVLYYSGCNSVSQHTLFLHNVLNNAKGLDRETESTVEFDKSTKTPARGLIQPA
jgi:hypothetical protein